MTPTPKVGVNNAICEDYFPNIIIKHPQWFSKGNWFLFFKPMVIKCFMLLQIDVTKDEAIFLLLLRKQCTVHFLFRNLPCSRLISTEIRHTGLWHAKIIHENINCLINALTDLLIDR